MGIEPLAGFRLDGRVAIVTGASSGLGERFARVLDALGAKLVLAARRKERLDTLAAELRDARSFARDLSEPTACAELIEMTRAHYGRVDVVVCNAGITRVVPAIKEPTDEFRRVIEVNLIAPFTLCREAVMVMKTQPEGGSIINVASINGIVSTPMLPQSNYVASKAGLIGLTRELAVQWARYKVRVNAIAPGMFPSEMTTDLVDHDEPRASFEQLVPLRRIGEPHELDGVLALLASSASTYVTGQTFVVDGGTTLV